MRKTTTAAAIVYAGALALAIGLGISGCTPTSPDAPCKVEAKDRSSKSGGGSVYRVYTSCGVFNVEDAPFVGQFNAADLYASIESGRTFRFETYGFRNGFFSTFPNITKATEVN